jgi:hypothetical protein
LVVVLFVTSSTGSFGRRKKQANEWQKTESWMQLVGLSFLCWLCSAHQKVRRARKDTLGEVAIALVAHDDDWRFSVDGQAQHIIIS